MNEEHIKVALENIAESLMCIARAINSSGGAERSGISLAEAVIVAAGKEDKVK